MRGNRHLPESAHRHRQTQPSHISNQFLSHACRHLHAEASRANAEGLLFQSGILFWRIRDTFHLAKRPRFQGQRILARQNLGAAELLGLHRDAEIRRQRRTPRPYPAFQGIADEKLERKWRSF